MACVQVAYLHVKELQQACYFETAAVGVHLKENVHMYNF